MQLVLDIGNTAIKAAWFRGRELLEIRQINDQASVLPDQFNHPIPPDRVIVSSVRDKDPEFLSAFSVPVHYLNSSTPLPFILQYDTPQTLGADRIANAAGAIVRFPGQNTLIIDTGTCLKIDLVLAGGIYAGGSISPGFRMRYQAMHAFTGRLPLLDSASEADLTGTSTAGSMHSGVINGMAAEIDGMISRYLGMFPEIFCILTGGDAAIFSGKLKSRIFAAPTLTLEGLNSILLHLQ